MYGFKSHVCSPLQLLLECQASSIYPQIIKLLDTEKQKCLVENTDSELLCI